MSYFMGYYYDEPKRGNGWNITVRDEEGKCVFHIATLTKASAMKIKSEFRYDGYAPSSIIIERN